MGQAADRRLGVGDEPATDEEARGGIRVEDVSKRLEAELEPVALRLVAAEQDDGPVGGRGSGREAADVDGVRKDLPRPSGSPRKRSEERFENALW